MSAYKLVKDLITQKNANVVIRLFDNASIPCDPDNTDYQEFLAWKAAGNEPLPSDTP